MPNLELLLHEVRQRIDYEELFQEFVTLRGRGQWRDAFCLWHENTDTPALRINVEEGGFKCMNPACGAHEGGDFITFYRRVRSLNFRDAVIELGRRVGLSVSAYEADARREEYDHAALTARNDALLETWRPPSAVTSTAAEPPPQVQVIDEAIVTAMHERLLALPVELQWLEQRRGITRATVEQWKLGHDGQRYYIPIRDEDGRCVNIRRYRPDARQSNNKMISWRPGFGTARLWPLQSLNSNRVFLLEGEMDTLLALQLGLPALTTTSGAGTWRDEWTALFRDKDVAIVYDADAAGAEGSDRVARALHGTARSVRRVIWQYTEPAGFDFTDYIHGNGNTVDDFLRLVQNTGFYTPPPVTLEETRPLEEGGEPVLTLAEAAHARWHNKRVKVPIVVSGIESAPSLVPQQVVMFCGRHSGQLGDICRRCPNRPAPEGANGQLLLTLTYKGKDVLDYHGQPDQQVLRSLKIASGIPVKCPVVGKVDRESINVLALQLIPDVAPGVDTDGDRSYVTRRAFQVAGPGVRFMEANKSYLATMVTVSDPRTQGVVHIIVGAVESQSSIDTFHLSAQVISDLTAFRPTEDDGAPALWRHLDRVYMDLERVTKIYERRDLMLAVDLTYMSPLTFTFQGDDVVRGWVECLIIGDSRTGKTTIVQRLMNHYDAGEFSTGENTSFAGLVGGLNELQRSWFTRWGKIPLNDRRLLALDEASSMPHEQIARMSALRSSGVAEIVKIHAEKTTARTRKIWLSNARSNRPLSTYSQGVLAVKELIGAPEDIARFDIVVTAASGDVLLATINAERQHEVPEWYGKRLCQQRVMWAWSRERDQVVFTADATREILRLATEQGEKYRYSIEVPLVEPNEQRIKLARLSASAAAMFFSSDEGGNKVVVRPAHARFAYEYLERTYAKPSLAFNEYAAASRRKYELQTSDDVTTLLRRRPSAIRALLDQEQLTQSDLMEILGLDERAAMREAVTKLREAGFLRRVGSSFYVKTPAAITWLRSEINGDSRQTVIRGNGRRADDNGDAEGGDDPPW